MNATATFHAKKIKSEIVSEVDDLLTIEEMLSISINGKPYTITMRTPGDEEAHTRGILLTENVYTNNEKNPTFFVTEKNSDDIITKVNVVIDESELQQGIEQQRNLLSVSSCGMCGKYEMDLTLNGILNEEGKLKAALVEIMFDEMSKYQFAFSKTGGCHASAAFTLDGKLLACKEDIGRHNAVDKVIGELLLDRKLSLAKILIVSGRVSYEIISKAHKAGIPFLCAVSAPSSMAVEYCKQCGITLLAFCRKGQFTVYANEERVEL